MTDLQMGMIGLGGAAVVAVLAYNKWQEMKHRKLAEKLLNSQQPDILLDTSATTTLAEEPIRQSETSRVVDDRVEPLLRQTVKTSDSAQEHGRPAADDVEEARDSVEVSDPSADNRVRPEILAPLPLLSPAIDHIAIIELSDAVGAYRILQNQRLALARITKPIHWLGYNEGEEVWEIIDEDGDGLYRHLRVGLQLVDRKGPLSDGDLSVFHVAMQDLANELLGVAELPLLEPALNQAAQLDEFCANVDIQIGVNVISQGMIFPGTKLRALAESAGMVLDGEGRFARIDDAGNVLYVLINQQSEGFSSEVMRTLTTHAVTFLLDVPRVASGDRVLGQMVDTARRFAESLRGVVVDDNRRPLVDNALEPIRKQVAQYQASMAARQLPAGGKLALRLFA
ncbi:MAG: cell division protein ZipA C-terminal FtsZ-binding domain-containing protein [Candidatus Accumulibacter sp.]|nr:cell division protein ZipA C-terminal FtsZ-binding domain-containing protein [Accumulibacter sp.]